MRTLLALTTALTFVSCTSQNPLNVSQFHFRGEESTQSQVQMVSGEAKFRNNYNVSTADRQDQHGHYFVIRWDKKITDSQSDVEVILQYRQSSSGRTVKTLKNSIPNSSADHQTEFSVTGDNYLKNGRILAWNAKLKQNGKILATTHSFLWK